jgi:polyketide synthase PksN
VELGEVEAAVLRCPGVRDCGVVVAESDGEKTLFAHVVAAAGTQLDERTVRDALRAMLPPYMLPHRIVIAAALPEHASGKLDRVALARRSLELIEPAPLGGPLPAARPSGAALRRAVAAVWREAIGDPREPAADENFFDAGGDSLRLLKVHALLRERLGVSVEVLDLFEHTTIDALSTFIEGRAA